MPCSAAPEEPPSPLGLISIALPGLSCMAVFRILCTCAAIHKYHLKAVFPFLGAARMQKSLKNDHKIKLKGVQCSTLNVVIFL